MARAGRAVVVLEADAPGRGASTRNGGICGGMLRVPFGELSERHGIERAAALYREGQRALDYLAEFVQREGIACHFARVGRFTGAHTARHYETLARTAEVLRRHVGLEADMVGRTEQRREIGSDAYHGGRVLHRDAGLHPGLYHQGLLERTEEAGATVVAHTPVTGLARERTGFTVATTRGRLAARDVIVASNGYTGAATPFLRCRLVPMGSYMIATEPLGAEVMARLMPKGRMLTDTKRLLHYFRPSPDGERVLFGGRPARDEADLRTTGERLRRAMVGIYPELADARITHSWTGSVALTFDRLPHAGVHDGVHYAVGYCGSGVVMATYFGHKAALRVLGAREAASAFDGLPFPTLPFYSGRPWFVPLVGFYSRIADRLGW